MVIIKSMIMIIEISILIPILILNLVLTSTINTDTIVLTIDTKIKFIISDFTSSEFNQY